MYVCRSLEDKLLWDFPNTWDSRRIDLSLSIYLSSPGSGHYVENILLINDIQIYQGDWAICPVKGTVSVISSDPPCKDVSRTI